MPSRYEIRFWQFDPSLPKNTVSPPFFRSSKLSKSLNSCDDGWWIVHTTVRPVATMFFTARITTDAARESSPDVGSSMKMIAGLATSSTPIVSRFACSVERPAPLYPIMECAIGSISRSSMISRTNASLVLAETDRSSRKWHEKRRASITVAVGEWMSVCSTYPARREKVAGLLGWPFSRILPFICPPVFRFASTSSSVVLPAPDEPMSAVIVPGLA